MSLPRFAAVIALVLVAAPRAEAQQPDSARTDSAGRPVVTAAMLQAALDLVGQIGRA